MARYTHTVDKKGRVIVPARLRENLDGVLFVTLSLDENYLSAYTPEQFNLIREQISSLSGTDPDVRLLKRAIIGEAIECQFDSQGRISLTDNLWQWIGVEAGEEVCFIDMYDKVDICSKEFYEKSLADISSLSDLDLTRFNVQGL
ncbi:MAG: cell division/cell wall cluster transcriptional repressor MraZ [Clostridiaceae bacterium]|nr:cell division/cell wall cluster transcriptional repressor MraZ [Clostridiaceae bacterium]